MKELSIEEKAKAYDETLKVIKDNLNALNEVTETGAEAVNIQSIKNCFYRAFPELKECELTLEDIDTMTLEYVKKLNPTLSKLITKESLRASYYLRGEYDTYRQGLIDMYNKIKKYEQD